jgi:hypothetical protein
MISVLSSINISAIRGSLWQIEQKSSGLLGRDELRKYMLFQEMRNPNSIHWVSPGKLRDEHSFNKILCKRLGTPLCSDPT